MGLVFGDNQVVNGTPDGDDYDVLGENNTINGAGGDDSINTSEGANNVLNGDAGDDFLRGHGGDTFDGGADTDDALIDLQSSSSNIDALLQGFGEAGGVTFGGITARNIETAAIALGSGDDDIALGSSTEFSIFMGDGADRAFGGLLADEIAGGGGADKIYGGDNDDLLWGFGPASFAGAYVSMGLNGFDDGLVGDKLVGEGGDDTLASSLGNDVLNGGADVDTASYDGFDNGAGQPGVTVNMRKNIQVTGQAGSDRFVSIENLFGSGSDDVLRGDAGDNVINGSRGGDTIAGGTGADTLTGGDSNGPDFFVYRSVFDSFGASIDLITDFNFADRLDLRGIDAKEGKAGNQAFKVVDAFTGEEGQLVRTFDGTLTVVELDTNGDTIADGYITLTGDVPDDYFIL